MIPPIGRLGVAPGTKPRARNVKYTPNTPITKISEWAKLMSWSTP